MENNEMLYLLEQLKLIKNAPEYLQPMNLLILCKTDPSNSNQFEKRARILAEYGIPVEKIVPCMLDLLTVTIESMKEDDN